MEVILAGLPASSLSPEMKQQAVQKIAQTLPHVLPEEWTPLFTLGLTWSVGQLGDEWTKPGCVLLRALIAHPRAELLLPPHTMPALVKALGREAVPTLCALATVLLRTPALALGADKQRDVGNAVVDFLAFCAPLPPWGRF